jgi:hypothetical protein
MSQELRSQALEAISWRLGFSAFGKLREWLELDKEFVIQHFMGRIEQGSLITEQEWLESLEVKA